VDLSPAHQAGEWRTLCTCVDETGGGGSHEVTVLQNLILECVASSPKSVRHEAALDAPSLTKVTEMTKESETGKMIRMLEKFPDRGLLGMSPCPSCKEMRIRRVSGVERVQWLLMWV
jgi:hypothetical protein